MCARQIKKRKKSTLESQNKNEHLLSVLLVDSSIVTVAKHAKRVKSSVDSLRWRQIDVNEQLDDFEGFYGLEEVDDVEVVRKPNGIVSYHASSTASDGEWEGFADDSRVLVNGGNDSSESAGASLIASKPRNEDDDDLADVDYRVLSNLHQNSDVSEQVDMSGWAQLRLSAEVTACLARLRFDRPTPIQASAIPQILAGHDVIGKAATGSGKTMAFGVPIYERIIEQSLSQELKSNELATEKAPSNIVALVIAPTRELAHQLAKHLNALNTSTGQKQLRVATVTGGLSVQKQIRQLQNANVVVATPGRLWDVIADAPDIAQSTRAAQMLVLDEADRLLSEGHFQDLEKVLDHLNRVEMNEDGSTVLKKARRIKRQTLIFSATFDRSLQKKLVTKKPLPDSSERQDMQYLLSKIRFAEPRPKYIDVDPATSMPSTLKQIIIECQGMEKDLHLYAALISTRKRRTLVFVNSVSAVKRITPFLQELDIAAFPLQSNMPQKARLRSIERFTEGNTAILVATDVAARGIDVKNIEFIIHYHLPRTADTYIHRSGRTARAEQQGSSILLCAPEEVVGARRLLATVKFGSKHDTVQVLPVESVALDSRLLTELNRRAVLAKQIADAKLAGAKAAHADDWMREAAEDLGVDLDDDGEEVLALSRDRTSSKRAKNELEARELSKKGIKGLKSQLKSLLSQRINMGVSEKYLSSGLLDVDALLRHKDKNEFLGPVAELAFN